MDVIVNAKAKQVYCALDPIYLDSLATLHGECCVVIWKPL